MWWIDLIFAAILVLFAFVGWRTGLIKGVLQLFNSLVCIIVSACLARPFAQLLAKIGSLEGSVTNLFAKKFASSGVNDFAGMIGEEGMKIKDFLGLDGVKTNKFLRWLTEKFGGNNLISQGDTPSTQLGRVLGAVLLVIIAFAVLFVAFRILTMVLMRLLTRKQKTRNSEETAGAPKSRFSVNKLLGLFLGLGKGFLFLALFFVIASIIPYLNSIIGDAVQGTYLLKAFHNGVHSIMDNINLGKLIKGVFKGG